MMQNMKTLIWRWLGPTNPGAWCRCFAPVGLALTLFAAMPAVGADTLNWRTNENRVSADIRSRKLSKLLEEIASKTGWQVYVEPGTTHEVSAKFKDLPPREALGLLLGDLNFALVPETNAAPKLFVFRTTVQQATQLVRPTKPVEAGKAIPNELLVRLKPGAKIDDLARLLGAKVIGRIDRLNAYRLQFDDQAGTDSARQQLGSNPDVTSVDSNYAVERPEAPQALPLGAPPLQLQLKPPPDSGRIVIGLVDTAVQPLGNNLDAFLLKQLSVVGDTQPAGDAPTHGTAMAETILRALQNITRGNTSVQILPVNIYPGGGAGDAATTTFDVANGIVEAVNGGAKIINLSLGSPDDSSFLHSVIQDVSKLNIPLFAAAGNKPVAAPFYPAAYSEVTAVTAIDNGQLAPYAGRGSFVSLGAPGTSLIPFGNQTYGVQGTSVSSAFASGFAGGYMDKTGSSVSQMKSFLDANFGVKITPAK